MKVAPTIAAILVVFACAIESARTDTRPAAERSARPNVIVFTMDDMDLETVNIYGGGVPGITPNIDRLAKEGIRFHHAHLNSAVCQHSRQSMMTGLHPHRYGSLAFMPVPRGVPNLSERLMDAGVFTASFNKGRDYSSFKWSWFLKGYGGRGFGRDGKLFESSVREAIRRAHATGQPFYLGVNTSDPHRTYAGSDDEQRTLDEMRKKYPQSVDKIYSPPFDNVCSPEQAWLPPYVADLPDVRKEWAQYYNTAHRGDQTLGRILDLLDKEGLATNTIVIFFSDNGASFPTSKQNCYPYSTRTPLIIRWPGVIMTNIEDRTHMVSTMDIMPTILDVYDLAAPAKLDGRSFLPLLKGGVQEGRDHVFTTYNFVKPGLQVYPMRAVHTRAASYIFNAWSDGKTAFSAEGQSGLTFAAMERAAESNPTLAARVRHIKYREREELYGLAKDPWCLKNIVADSTAAELRGKLRRVLEQDMRATDDPLLPAFLDTGTAAKDWQHRARAGKAGKEQSD